MQNAAVALLVVLFIHGTAAQPAPQAPPIWTIVGGEVGIGSCYDIVTEAVTFPGLNFHYDTQNTVLAYGNTYLIPDEVFGYNSPEFLNDSRILIVDSFQYYYDQYVSTWGVSAGATVDGVTLSFAFSHTKGQINAYLSNKANMLAENVLRWSEFQLEMWPEEQNLTPILQSYIDKLPHQYDEDTYLNFVSNWGTHIIHKCWYGAMINFTSVFKSDLEDHTSITWVENQVKLSISWMEYNAGINWNNFNNKTHINDTFNEFSKNVTTVVGGQPAYLVAGGFKQWWQSVQTQNAVIFPMTELTPIFEFVKDPVVAANLKRATIAYGNGKKPRRIPPPGDGAHVPIRI